jgi:hypothetical protein
MVSRNLQCLVNKLCESRGVNRVPLPDANKPTFGFESAVSFLTLRLSGGDSRWFGKQMRIETSIHYWLVAPLPLQLCSP